MSSRKVEIAADFLVNAPPGEFEAVAKAITDMCPETDVVPAARQQSFKEWCHKNCETVKIGGRPVLLCPRAEVAPDTYICPSTLEKIRYDFKTKAIKSTKEKVEGSDMRKELQTALEKYIKLAYGGDGTAVGVYDGNKGEWHIVMKTTTLGTQNCKTGSIVAEYKLTPEGSLSGRITCFQHFYEGSNIITRQSSKMKTQIDPSAMAAGVCEKLKTFETKWLHSYIKAFSSLADKGVTKLIRKLPKTKTRVNWEAEFRGTANIASV